MSKADSSPKPAMRTATAKINSSRKMKSRQDGMLEGWNDAVEIVKTVEAVQIVGRPKQEVRREKGMME
jgi:hypothetical protein